jgi:hypothetical protein
LPNWCGSAGFVANINPNAGITVPECWRDLRRGTILDEEHGAPLNGSWIRVLQSNLRSELGGAQIPCECLKRGWEIWAWNGCWRSRRRNGRCHAKFWSFHPLLTSTSIQVPHE